MTLTRTASTSAQALAMELGITNLLPCPFCGSTKLEVFANVVVCEECEAKGPCSQEGPECTMNPHIRDQDWNRRSDERDGWQPIETAPKDGSQILVLCGDAISVAAWTQRRVSSSSGYKQEPDWVAYAKGVPVPDEGWDFGGGWTLELNDPSPSHWKPLPSTPGASE